MWPSVLDADPNERDDRTEHESVAVVAGTKFAASARHPGLCLSPAPAPTASRPGPHGAPHNPNGTPHAHGISAAARHVHCVRHPPRSQSRCAPVCCPQITGCTCGTFSSRRVTVAATPRSLAIGRACEAWRRCCVEVADVFSLVARLNPETQASRAWFAWSRSSS